MNQTMRFVIIATFKLLGVDELDLRLVQGVPDLSTIDQDLEGALADLVGAPGHIILTLGDGEFPRLSILPREGPEGNQVFLEFNNPAVWGDLAQFLLPALRKGKEFAENAWPIALQSSAEQMSISEDGEVLRPRFNAIVRDPWVFVDLRWHPSRWDTAIHNFSGQTLGPLYKN